MSSERFKMQVYCVIILRKDNQVLLIKRSKSVILGGLYAFPGGGVDGLESVTVATIRESYEELGIVLNEEDLKFMCVLHVQTELQKEYVAFFFQAMQWVGQPSIMEPEKCDDLAWFDLNDLPKNMVPSHQLAVAMMNKNEQFYEFGW